MNQIKNCNKIFDQINLDCHRYVIDTCHRYGVEFPLKQLKFIEVAFSKHQLTGEYFTHNDFPYMTKNNFSQMIIRINKRTPMIKKQKHGYPSFYSLIGISIDQKVIEKGTGVNNSFINQKIEQLFSLTNNQQPHMHDIRLSSRTSQLYDKLLQIGLTPHPNNKQFIIPILSNSRFSTKAQISPNGRMDVMIGCSQVPIPATHEGFSELTEHIAEVKYYLSIMSQSAFISEPAHRWIFEYYHFNRDSEPIIDASYRFSLGQLTNYLYLKKFDNGEIKARYEEKKRTKTRFIEEQENVIESLKPVYQKASELETGEDENS